jgi:hypothetical protein
LRVTILAPNSVVSTWQREAIRRSPPTASARHRAGHLAHQAVAHRAVTSEILERKGQRA